jgi:hypothetical protein
MAVPVGAHEIYEDHIRLDSAISGWNTFQASSRLSTDLQENMYGHRSGIGATNVGGMGVQTVATAYATGALNAGPKKTFANWYEVLHYRYNVDGW